MVMTITLNPSLDYVTEAVGSATGSVIRTQNETIYPGGKGINVSLVLKQFGIPTKTLGFYAGFTGKELCRMLNQAGCEEDMIELPEGLTRINVKVSGVRETELNGSGPHIDSEAFSKLMEKLSCLKAGDFVVLAGSIPASLLPDAYERILSVSVSHRAEVIVDVSGDLLKRSLLFSPFLIKPNHHELGELFGVVVRTREDAVHYARKLQECGARNVLVSMAEQGAVLVAENGEAYAAEAPRGKLVNSVGAGDSMVAGFLAGWLHTKSFEDALRLGICAGSATAFSPWLAQKETVLSLLCQSDKEDFINKI